MLRHVEDTIPDLRGLNPLRKVDMAFMSRQELADFLASDLDEYDKASILKVGELMAVMELIPEDVDLFELVLDLYEEQILGLYDPETEQIYLIDGQRHFRSGMEVTLAHEYIHALQQQHFDLASLGVKVKGDWEAEDALSALIEGDAYLHSLNYTPEFLTAEDREFMLTGNGNSNGVFETAPHAVRQLFLFAPLEGLKFVAYLSRHGGHAAINDAFLDPPVTTEQVLHPEKYLSKEEAIPVLLPNLAKKLGPHWTRKDTGILGEYFLRTYLERDTSKEVANVAAEGWGGSQYQLLHGPGNQRLFVLLSVWDTHADASDFAKAIIGSASNHIYHRDTVINGPQVLLIIAESPELIQTVRTYFPEF